MTLILLGNGVVAGVSLKGSYAENGGWIVITTAWGLAVICAVIVALAVGSNAHLNPAVTIGVAIATGDWSLVPSYVAAQLLGALLGAVLVWLHYFPLWRQTDNPAGKRACFCTSPAVRHAPSNALSEIIGTFVLVFVAAAISSDNLSPNGLAPRSPARAARVGTTRPFRSSGRSLAAYWPGLPSSPSAFDLTPRRPRPRARPGVASALRVIFR
jgi:glycerol uptake facilitator protein